MKLRTLIILTTLALAAGWLLGASSLWPKETPPTLQSYPYSNPDPYVDPIYTAEDAISRTLALIPSELENLNTEARLVSRATIATMWDALGTTGGNNLEDIMPDVPIWVVGIEASNMTIGDTDALPGLDMGVEDSTPTDGMYFFWEANNGWPNRSGLLTHGTSESMATLQSLPNESLAIHRATEIPIPTPE